MSQQRRKNAIRAIMAEQGVNHTTAATMYDTSRTGHHPTRRPATPTRCPRGIPLSAIGPRTCRAGHAAVPTTLDRALAMTRRVIDPMADFGTEWLDRARGILGLPAVPGRDLVTRSHLSRRMAAAAREQQVRAMGWRLGLPPAAFDPKGNFMPIPIWSLVGLGRTLRRPRPGAGPMDDLIAAGSAPDVWNVPATRTPFEQPQRIVTLPPSMILGVGRRGITTRLQPPVYSDGMPTPRPAMFLD